MKPLAERNRVAVGVVGILVVVGLVVVDVLGGGRTDFLTAKRVSEPRCRASHTSDSSERPMTRSKSKAREKAKVSGARREGEGSRSVAEEAVTWR